MSIHANQQINAGYIMNNNNLYEFYRNNAFLITQIKEVQDLYRRQLCGSGGALFTEITLKLSQIERYPQYLDQNAFHQNFISISSSMDSEDYSSLADSLNSFIYEVLIPIQQAAFSDLQDHISNIYNSLNKYANGTICLEETASGYPTLLYRSDKPRYLCSVEDPMMEANILAKEAFTPEADSYHVWGMGLGYHIYALYQISHGSADIYVYDNDSFLFDIAQSGELGPWQNTFKSKRIHFINDQDITHFSASLAIENSKYLIHLPSLYKLPEITQSQLERKTILKKIQITINSFSEQKNDILLNFYRNVKNTDGFAEELFEEYEGKTIVIVAAGPSLDKNIHILKKAVDDGVPIKILCVGTVFRKLINTGITPNAFFVMDPGKNTYAQLSGLEHLDVPLILNTSAYYEFAQNYQGKKYLACQKGLSISEKLNHTLFNTGGSVTTLALDFAIQAKAKKIILIGCDMAFTGNVSHAKGTPEKHSTQNDSVIYVKEYYGGTIASGILLSIYREWIEKRIKCQDVSDISFYNSTEGGAYIEGMSHISLKDVLTSV